MNNENNKEIGFFLYSAKAIDKNKDYPIIEFKGKDVLINIHHLNNDDGKKYKEKTSIEIIEILLDKMFDVFEKNVVSMVPIFLKKVISIDCYIDMYEDNKKVGVLGIDCLYFSDLKIVLKDCNIFHPDFIKESDEKYYYAVSDSGYSDTGFILLTAKEAANLNYYTNKKNWNFFTEEDSFSNFKIDIWNPYPVDSDITKIANPFN